METVEQELGLLDLLVVVLENVKVLVLVPVVAGLLALGITFIIPETYTSRAILTIPSNSGASGTTTVAGVSCAPNVPSLPTPHQVATLLVSPVVLDPVIQSEGLLSGGRTIEEARTALASRIKATVGRENLLRLEISAERPEQAQRLSEVILTTWLKSSAPSGREREDLLSRLAFAKMALKSTQQLLDRLADRGHPDLGRFSQQASSSVSFFSVGELHLRYSSEISAIERALDGVQSDVVKQWPSLPTEPSAPRKEWIVMGVTIVVALTMFFFILLRHAWRVAAQDVGTAKKQARVLAALGFRKQ